MFNKLCNIIRSSPIKTIPIIILVIFLTATSNVYSYKMESQSFAEFKNTLKQQAEEEIWKQISTMIELADVSARQNSKFIAKKLEADILRQYSDINELRSEFEGDVFGQKFHNILKENLIIQNTSPSALNPHSFYTIVGLEKGILEIFSSSNSGLEQSSTNQIVDWNTFIKASANPTLTQKAIDSVLSRDRGIIFLQTSSNGDQPPVTEMNMDTLRKVYEQGGIEAFKQFSIVSPSYITDNGDIFNIDDQTYMTKNKNYKLIILQCFNLYDILYEYRSELQQTQYLNDHNVTVIEGFEEMEFLRTVFWSVILFIVCIFFVHIYNTDMKTCAEYSKRVRRMD